MAIEGSRWASHQLSAEAFGLAPRSEVPRSCRVSLACRSRRLGVSAALKDWRSDGSGSSPFNLNPTARERLERAWSIQKQPVPVACEACGAQGMKECNWCSGSGYFVLGDKMLCEVPSRNTSCVICHGEGSVRCSDCHGTGFRARWLESMMGKKK